VIIIITTIRIQTKNRIKININNGRKNKCKKISIKEIFSKPIKILLIPPKRKNGIEKKIT
jgi:hypothetical protein